MVQTTMTNSVQVRAKQHDARSAYGQRDSGANAHNAGLSRTDLVAIHNPERHAPAIRHLTEATSIKATQILECLSAVGPEIVAQSDTTSVFRVLDRHVDILLGSASFAIYLLESDGHCLSLAFANDFALTISPISVHLSNPVALMARCVRERREILIDKVSGLDYPDHATLPAELSDTMHIPLLAGERTLGAMVVRTHDRNAYDAHDLMIFRTLCTYGAIALDNIATAQNLESTLLNLREKVDENLQLEHACHTFNELNLPDPLSGFSNRRSLVEQVEGEIKLCLDRYDHWLRQSTNSLPVEADLNFLLVNIDHFKEINSTFGLGVGNALLVQMRQRLHDVCRESDFLVRWGADEFLVVARASNRMYAESTAERIRQAVAAQAFDLPDGTRIAATCSIGFSSFPYLPLFPRLLSWNQVIDFADHGLSIAKQAGRNGWAGLFGTERAQPDSVFQGILQHTGATNPADAIRVVTSTQSK